MNHFVLNKGWEKINTGHDEPCMPKNEIYLPLGGEDNSRVAFTKYGEVILSPFRICDGVAIVPGPGVTPGNQMGSLLLSYRAYI